MTAVELLENKLKTYLSWSSFLEEDFEQAKEMEKQQIIDAFDSTKIVFAETYYNEIIQDKKKIKTAKDNSKIGKRWEEYKKWLNEIPEISDEEIETIGESYRIFYNGKEGNGNLVYKHYTQGIKWYREQLKQKI